MGEEQSGFKVTDRRLFNADGSPRDIAPAAEPAKDNAGVTAEPAPADPVAAGANAETTSASAQPATENEAPPSAADDLASTGDAAVEPDDGEDLPGANDPASFINFLMSPATNAAAALGMMPHPGTGESGVDLELAKHWIDVLGMLRQKTRGNLAPKEDQMFEGILADLRMQYVSLTSGPAQPPKFSGRDIIGGR
ncbi:MAG: hypothetical protein QOD75_2248 [Blastocatellia bacterium]|jgi:hypothetical protein|nr:hypothetical protein [Blastocatellia bacterium]